MTRWVHAIRRGWVVLDRVPGPDVDEFADAAEVVAALAQSPCGDDTLLAVQHPHRTPAALAGRLSLADALPAARRALDRLRASAYRPVVDVVAPYRVDGPDGPGGPSEEDSHGEMQAPRRGAHGQEIAGQAGRPPGAQVDAMTANQVASSR